MSVTIHRHRTRTFDEHRQTDGNGKKMVLEPSPCCVPVQFIKKPSGRCTAPIVNQAFLGSRRSLSMKIRVSSKIASRVQKLPKCLIFVFLLVGFGVGNDKRRFHGVGAKFSKPTVFGDANPFTEAGLSRGP